jgi:hypothetical protein
MSGRIVFVHGMGEKPAREVERQRTWAPLRRALWLPVPDDAWSVAYWADLRLPPDGPPPRCDERLLRQLPFRQRASLGWAAGGLRAYLTRPDLLLLNAGERIHRLWNFAVSRGVVFARAPLTVLFDHLMRDLRPYLAGVTRECILERLTGEFAEARRHGPICVVSHSMGTVVAFDAILRFDGDIDTFVTLGTPLGWEYVKAALGTPAFPDNLRHWINMYDRYDDVAIRHRGIADDYPDRDGARWVEDRRVRDNYAPNGDRDSHHWFGYLSSPEMADVIGRFWIGTRESGAEPPAVTSGF